MTAYYNEIDPYAAQWLRNLIDLDLIAPGDVDERSIVDVRPADLRGYTQCHFFAGIGVWSYALRRAGWPDDRPVWTGSCPCGPFSQAGQRKGFDDERHLWSYWHFHIAQCRPDTVFGEQVSSTDGLAWLDLVQADMEGTNYAFAAPDICSAGVGAPNIRQRSYFVAYSIGNRLQGRIHGRPDPKRQILDRPTGCHGAACKLDNSECHGLPTSGTEDGQHERRFTCATDTVDFMANAEGVSWRNGLCHCQAHEIGRPQSSNCIAVGRVADAHDDRCQSETVPDGNTSKFDTQSCSGTCQLVDGKRPGPTNGFWRDADWLFCRDERWRPVEPGTFPLASGITQGLERGRPEQERLAIRAARTYRRGTLKGYGNALNAELATTFITEAMNCINDLSGEAQS
ncbi:DNA (cytosine-5)-methyltransferase 1 [Thalassospira sp. MBR-102]|uniref:DNA cytosine methyltransferase n=1 Tax=Thalassospira sp. MBR-102 TaxID=3156466 RepID=UPI00339957E3